MWFWISFVLLGLVVYLPIGIFLFFILESAVDACLQKSRHADLAQPITYILLFLLFGSAILVHGGLFGWYDKLEKPDSIIISVDDEVKNDFYKYEEKDDKIYLTVTDKNFYASSSSHLIDNGNIHFNISNKNAEKDRANLKWTIKIEGREYEKSSLPTGTEIHLFSDNFSLKTGETVATITAKNNLGETTKTIIINKLSTETECAKSENAEIPMCKNLIAANLADSEKKAKEEAERQARKEALKQNQANTSPTYNNTVDNTTSTTNCSYFKYGKCWDDIIEQADEDGAMDAYLTEGGRRYGYSYYRGCDGVCSDIYDDAYYKAFDNYSIEYEKRGY